MNDTLEPEVLPESTYLPTDGFVSIEDGFVEEHGGARWIRRIDPMCWISAMHRMTGFGYMEWETALVFIHEVEGRERTWKDRDCLIIAGDRREELASMPKEHLCQWYADHIEGNRNSMETLLEALKPADPAETKTITESL